MKAYLEALRRLSRVALILLVLCVVASMIIAMQFCMNDFISSVPSLWQMFLPVIIYLFIGGIALAMDGFSFLNKRSDSDFYHSLPVSRRRLFWSVTLAALTWIAATVLAGTLTSVVIYTVSRTPFVANYALAVVPFCIAGGMLVFAAAAIAMNLTGTWLTNIAMTLVVLGLPRFLQFVVARGILARFSMMSWLDLPWYLTPVTNVATGQIVTFTHNMLQTRLYSPWNAVYSLLLAAAELTLACLLFVRRPSELAEHGAKNAKAQTLFTCLTILPIGVLFASGFVKPTTINILIVAAVALALYAIEQIVLYRNSRKVIRSLPWALIPVALSALMYVGIRIPVNSFQNDIPMIQDVAYIQFPGANRNNGTISYDEYRVSLVKFTDQDVKDYVLNSLRENVAFLDRWGNVNYQTDSHYTSLEPIRVVLNNGRTIGRVVWFTNSNTLNTLRDRNAEYAKAIRALPPEDSVCYQQTYDVYNPNYQSIEPIVKAYYSDIRSMGLIPNWTYNQHADTDDYSMEGKQSYGSLLLSGYVGSQRYIDFYEIRRETPNASAAWMQWQNNHSTSEYFDVLKQIGAQASSFYSNSDFLNCTMSFYNVPLSNGMKQFNSFYYNRSATDTTKFNSSFEPLANEMIDILSRGTPTTDPNAFCVFFTWSGRAMTKEGSFIGEEIIRQQAASASDAVATGMALPNTTWGNVVYYSSGGNASYYAGDGTIISYNPSYRSFSAADEARMVEILKEWQALQKDLQFNYEESAPAEIVIQSPSRVYATPTPVP